MNITVELPDNIIPALQTKWQNLPRLALESVALEAYRAEVLTTAELQHLLGYDTEYALDGFLKDHGVYFEYTPEELEREAENSRLLLSRNQWQQESTDSKRRAG